MPCAGFQSGFIQFDDAENTAGQASGRLPDGDFAEDTRLEFCCRNDGFTSTPLINVPNIQPLVLLMVRQKSACQEIAGAVFVHPVLKCHPEHFELQRKIRRYEIK